MVERSTKSPSCLSLEEASEECALALIIMHFENSFEVLVRAFPTLLVETQLKAFMLAQYVLSSMAIITELVLSRPSG